MLFAPPLMVVHDKRPSPFGVHLRRLRLAAGLTQETLAERAHISVDAISTLESGRRQRPHPQTVSMLAAGLGLEDDERAQLAALARPEPRLARAVAARRSGPSPQTERRSQTPWAPLRNSIKSRPFAAASVVAIVTATVLATAAYIWRCPHEFCSQGPAPHDQILEVDLTALQATSYVLPDNPDSYSLKRLPATSGDAAIVAERIDAGAPYRVAIAIHDLRRDGASTFIEAVRVLLRQVRQAQAPLPVWETGTSLDYSSNLFLARYSGQTQGVTLRTNYAGQVPQAHVQLRAGESDELTVQVTSALPVDLRFQVQILYRIASELQVRSVLLPDTLQVTFTDDLDWQPYQLKAGRFVPAPDG